MSNDTRFTRLLLGLAKKITSKAKLEGLATLLGVDDFTVEGIAYDAKSINEAAQDLLVRKWRRLQYQTDNFVLVELLRPAFEDALVELGPTFAQEVEKVFPGYANDGGAAAAASDAFRPIAVTPPPVQAVGGAGETADHSPAPAQELPPVREGGDGVNKRAPKAVLDKGAAWTVPEIPKSGDVYEISDPLGKAVVINNEYYDDGEHRKGTNHDANRVVRVLRKIGFELTDGWVESDPANKNPFSQETTNNNPRPADEPPILKDMEAWQIMQRLDNVSKDMDSGKYSCFCCFILTHGHENQIKTVEGNSLGLVELINRFKPDYCKGLVGKPKLFFIQACQGSLDDMGHTGERHDDAATIPQLIHKDADIFVFYAAPFGFRSYRHEAVGSRFIQCLCEVLECHYHNRHILEIATAVTQMVQEIRVENGPVQIPMMTSTLRKPFYFVRQ